MSTLVTGAAGFAGSHLLDLLVRTDAKEPHQIVAWHRPGEGRDPGPTYDGEVRWTAVHVLDRAGVRNAIEQVRPSVVYHCAGAAHVGQAWDRNEMTFATNVRGTDNVLDALARLDQPVCLLIPSSALVYAAADRPLREDDPLVPSSPYGLSKLAQEMLARHSGKRVTVTLARAFNHIGPRQDPHFAASGFARRIADIERGRWEPAIHVGNLEARRDLTDVRDTIRAYKMILDHGSHGEPFNVCSGTAISIRDLLDKLIARARVPVRVEVDPARYRPNDTPVIIGDASRIRTTLGWTPQFDLDRTLDNILEYWRNREQ
jgi:GDP-4-dehydro-6-deoxy-D-mannose reductase